MQAKRKSLVEYLNKPIIQSVLYSRFLDFHQFSLLSFVKKCARDIKPDENILDAGAGELKYKAYFDHCNYTSQDLCVGDDRWFFNDIDIKSSIYDIPVEDKSFNYILCAQVLEHLEFPEKAFRELSRIIKPGGKLFLTAPLGQGEHQVPYDYFRYTRYGLKSLGERSGFRLVSIESHGGIFINLEYVIWWAISMVIPFKKISAVRYFMFFLLLPVKFISGIFFYLLDFLDREKTYTHNYNCVYEKVD